MHRQLLTGLMLIALAPAVLAAPGEDGLARAKEAAVALQRGNVEQAVQLYTEALNDPTVTNDRRAVIHNDRGVAYQRLNLTREAIEDFNRAVQLFPEGASAYNNRGNVLLGLGLYKEAVKDFERALTLAPGYAAAYNNRAGALAKLGEVDAAIRDYSRAIQLNPSSPAPLNGRGRLHLAQNRPHAALRDFNRAVGFDARFGPGYRARAEARLMLERYDEAVEDLSRAAAFDPSNIEIYLLRGHAYLAAKNTASAVRDFDKALELDPRSSAALEARAFAQAKAEAHQEALNDLASAIELNPRSALAYAYRAWVYRLMGQPELGQRDIERAMRLEPGRAEVLWVRGELLEAAGDTETAISELKKALAAKPMLSEAAAALERLGVDDEGEAAEIVGLGLDRWQVYLRAGRYHAESEDYPRLTVPLEMMSQREPRLLEWDVKKGALKGIGVLRFSAGTAEGRRGPEEVEHAAVVDLHARSVIAVEAVRQGDRTANWTWDDNRLVVASVDGFTEEYLLRSRPSSSQRRLSAAESAAKSGGTPFWAPWATPNDRRDYDNRNQRSRSQQPKSLFDLIFKKW